MPLKASIGLSRKIGQENYGSLGANCQLEVELDASLVADAETFHEKIRRLYALANQAVTDQLAQQNNGHAASTDGNGHEAKSNGNGHTEDPPASNKQIKYLLDIARQQHNLTLSQVSDMCEELVGQKDVYQLTKRQASTVIDKLSGKETNGRRKYAAGRT